MKKTFSIKQAFIFGWNTFKKQWTFYVAIIISALALSLLASIVEGALGSSFLAKSISTVISIIVQLFISIGFITIFIRSVRERSVGWNDFIRNKDRMITFLGVSILYQIMVILGLVLLIIPGIYIALRYQYASYIVIDDKDVTVGKAFKRSAEMTHGVKLRIILLSFASFGVILLGLLVLGIGVFVAIPVIGIAQAYVYLYLRKAYHDDFLLDGHTKMIDIEKEPIETQDNDSKKTSM